MTRRIRGRELFTEANKEYKGRKLQPPFPLFASVHFLKLSFRAFFCKIRLKEFIPFHSGQNRLTFSSKKK
jgi:hypothetical protein